MIVHWIAAGQALVYLWAVPVNLAVHVDDAAGLRFGAGASVFAREAARDRARRRAEGMPSRRRRKSKPDRRVIWRLARRLRFERAELRGSLSLGDAAATALACGALNALALSLRARAGSVRAGVRPDFSSDKTDIALEGMLCARVGQIILAVFPAFPDRRNHPWTSTPLKTS